MTQNRAFGRVIDEAPGPIQKGMRVAVYSVLIFQEFDRILFGGIMLVQRIYTQFAVFVAAAAPQLGVYIVLGKREGTGRVRARLPLILLYWLRHRVRGKQGELAVSV